MKMWHRPYLVLVSGDDGQRYVDAETEEEALDIAISEYSKGAFACIAYYWNPDWDTYLPLLEKNRLQEVEEQ